MLTDENVLGDVTRKERRILLGLSMMALFVIKAGFIPKKIEALGIEFAPKDQNVLLIFFILFIVYFLSAFLLYARDDYNIWNRKRSSLDLSIFGTLRVFIDILLPIMLGIYSVRLIYLSLNLGFIDFLKYLIMIF